MRCAVFLPKDNTFYRTMLRAMLRAFADQGVDAIGETKLLSGREVHAFCDAYHPDFIFEMNRSRIQLPELPSSVGHVAWIVDLLGNDLGDYGGSDVLYFFGTNWHKIYRGEVKGIVDWLPPGVCLQNYFPAHALDEVDFSFIGHIPNPWTREELDRSVYHDVLGPVSFEAVSNILFDYWRNVAGPGSMKHNNEYVKLLERALTDSCGKVHAIDDEMIRYDLMVRNSRLFGRCRLIDHVLSISDSVRIYGPNNWQRWDQYVRFYMGWLEDPDEIRSAYQAAKFNLHEGVGPHFRVFDCMASGGVILYKSNFVDDCYSSMDSIFEPYEHYIPFTDSSLQEVVDRYLFDHVTRRLIGQKAATLVANKHSWRVRARKIIADYKMVHG